MKLKHFKLRKVAINFLLSPLFCDSEKQPIITKFFPRFATKSLKPYYRINLKFKLVPQTSVLPFEII